jgi:hypothetical protein
VRMWAISDAPRGPEGPRHDHLSRSRREYNRPHRGAEARAWPPPRPPYIRAEEVYGGAGRNILIAPGFFNTDFGLFKRFRFDGPTRRNEIQIRLEAFNVFNEPPYRQPNATVDLLDAGRITGIVGTMREMQVGIKFLF